MILFLDLLDSAFELARALGLPLLCLIFVAHGLLVGKIFPTSLFLLGYVVVTGASLVMAGVIALATAVAWVGGQLVLYWGCRRRGASFVEALPYVSIDVESDRFRRFDRWFRRYGGLSLFAVNCVPWIRGLVTIPAGTMQYPARRYVFYTTSSAILYHVLYVAVGLWILALLG